MNALNLIEEAKTDFVVVSLPATAAIGERGNLLRTVAGELGYRIVTAFVLSKTPDLIHLVAELHQIGKISVSDSFVVILNEFFGKASDFRRWDDSQIKRTIVSDPRCAAVSVLPELFYRQWTFCRRRPIIHPPSRSSPVSLPWRRGLS